MAFPERKMECLFPGNTSRKFSGSKISVGARAKIQLAHGLYSHAQFRNRPAANLGAISQHSGIGVSTIAHALSQAAANALQRSHCPQ